MTHLARTIAAVSLPAVLVFIVVVVVALWFFLRY